jgi:hypothetical protein
MGVHVKTRFARPAAMLLSGTMLIWSAAGYAQTAAPDTAMAKLVEILVAQGVVSKAQGEALTQQAVAEVNRSRAAQAAPCPYPYPYPCAAAPDGAAPQPNAAMASASAPQPLPQQAPDMYQAPPPVPMQMAEQASPPPVQMVAQAAPPPPPMPMIPPPAPVVVASAAPIRTPAARPQARDAGGTYGPIATYTDLQAPPPPPSNSARFERAPAAPAQEQLPAPTQGSMRVPYIPAPVRDQIKQELKNEIMQQARAEGWAAPDGAAPEWTRRIQIGGDIRFRSESDLFARGNATNLIDYDRFNRTGPIDIVNQPQFPFLNTREDKWNQFRIRARLNLNAQITKGVDAGLMLATGDDNGPISTNASLGGGFGKRDFWLQQAWFRLSPTDSLSLTFGRAPNPFTHADAMAGRFPNAFNSTDLLFDRDLAFDGATVDIGFKPWLPEGWDLRVRGGVYSLDYGDPNFVSADQTKRSFPEKYLFSAQAEATAPVGGAEVTLGAAYHVFRNVQGGLSDLCNIYQGVKECSTDASRPFFLRKGNTLSYLRQIAIDPNFVPTAGQLFQPQPQYAGLVFGYRLLNGMASVSIPLGDDKSAKLTGEYVRNLAFHRSDLCRFGQLSQPLNNLGPTPTGGTGDVCTATNATPFVGGNTGYQIQAAVGYKQPRRAGQWQIEGGYRYVESDAVLDSFTDSDFHLGGTNAKGYFVGGTYGIFDRVNLGARWLSANEISGPPLGIDVLLVDLEVIF